MKKFNFESALEARGFNWERIFGDHQFLETENGYRWDFRVCEDQIICCFQDRADGLILFDLMVAPKSQEEFYVFWQEHPRLDEEIESGKAKPLMVVHVTDDMELSEAPF